MGFLGGVGMADTIKPKSITGEYLADLARRYNSVGPNPIETVLGGRAKLLAELDSYLASPDCFADTGAAEFAKYTRNTIG
jgi:hypothetical protein